MRQALLAALLLLASSVVQAQTTELPFIVVPPTGQNWNGRACNSLPWPSTTIWPAPRVPRVGDWVLFGTSCSNATVRQIATSTPLTQAVVTCNALPGDTAQQCSSRGEQSEPLSRWLTPPPPPPPPRPTVVFAAAPLEVPAGGSTVLTWSSVDATSCIAGGAWSGTKAVSGSERISNVWDPLSFSITCQGAGGFSDVVVASVTVGPPLMPSCGLSAGADERLNVYYRDTKDASGNTDPARPAAMVMFCGRDGFYIVGPPADFLVRFAEVWGDLARPPTADERAFALDLLEDYRPPADGAP